ncbi:hypothetical protein HPG69_018182, partial [Diceros bicornis minor]
GVGTRGREAGQGPELHNLGEPSQTPDLSGSSWGLGEGRYPRLTAEPREAPGRPAAGRELGRRGQREPLVQGPPACTPEHPQSWTPRRRCPPGRLSKPETCSLSQPCSRPPPIIHKPHQLHPENHASSPPSPADSLAPGAPTGTMRPPPRGPTGVHLGQAQRRPGPARSGQPSSPPSGPGRVTAPGRSSTAPPAPPRPMPTLELRRSSPASLGWTAKPHRQEPRPLDADRHRSSQGAAGPSPRRPRRGSPGPAGNGNRASSLPPATARLQAPRARVPGSQLPPPPTLGPLHAQGQGQARWALAGARGGRGGLAGPQSAGATRHGRSRRERSRKAAPPVGGPRSHARTSAAPARVPLPPARDRISSLFRFPDDFSSLNKFGISGRKRGGRKSHLPPQLGPDPGPARVLSPRPRADAEDDTGIYPVIKAGCRAYESRWRAGSRWAVSGPEAGSGERAETNTQHRGPRAKQTSTLRCPHTCPHSVQLFSTATP